MNSQIEPIKLAADRSADGGAIPSSANASDGACAAPAAAVTPIGALLARHIIRDGEIVLLALKPSLWFVLLTSLRFIATVLIFLLAAIAWESRHNREWFYIEAAIFLIAGRIMWAVLAWMGRLYVLTDLRVIRLSGVFKVDITDCALRKIGRTQVTTPLKEKVCATGTVEITPEDQSLPPIQWQTLSKALEVQDLINRTIAKAKHHGLGAAA
jgi:hypothetical protein